MYGFLLKRPIISELLSLCIKSISFVNDEKKHYFFKVNILVKSDICLNTCELDYSDL